MHSSYVVGTADSALIREVFFIERLHCKQYNISTHTHTEVAMSGVVSTYLCGGDGVDEA